MVVGHGDVKLNTFLTPVPLLTVQHTHKCFFYQIGRSESVSTSCLTLHFKQIFSETFFQTSPAGQRHIIFLIFLFLHCVLLSQCPLYFGSVCTQISHTGVCINSTTTCSSKKSYPQMFELKMCMRHIYKMHLLMCSIVYCSSKNLIGFYFCLCKFTFRQSNLQFYISNRNGEVTNCCEKQPSY